MARATAMVISPTGPQPVTSTFLAVRSAVKAVWTALPKFSCSTAISTGMSGGFTQAFCAGMAMYSAKPPSVSTPIRRVFWQMWPRPVRQYAQMLQMTWLSSETKSPILGSTTLAPRSTTSPHTSCPTITGGRRRLAAQASQR